MFLGKLRHLTMIALFGILISACTTTSFKPNVASVDISGSKLVLLPLDVELSELSAGGATEPRADWTAQAHGHLKKLMSERLAESNVAMISADQAGKPDDFVVEEKRLMQLHSVVGASIILHKARPFIPLPTKKDVFDWELGDKVAQVKDQYGADYGLFIFVRDSYASAGRAAVMIIGAAFGVGITGGQQVGYASLVNLETGRIEWFNFLQSGSGDLRNEDAAANVVDRLLTDFPAL